jgi:glycosyltransferase involved in cell wall biosynthesis
MNKQQLVSVIIPVYNAEHYLGEAIESVINQTYQPVEIIVINDGSTDCSEQIAQSYSEVRYICQTNQGCAAARNTGLEASQGGYLAFQDADDIWLNKKLEIQMDFLFKELDFGGTICYIDNFLDPEIARNDDSTNFGISNEIMSLISLVARKSVFDRVGGFNTDYRVCSDFEWFTRSKDAGIKIKILEEVLLHRRVHRGNISSQMQIRKKNMLKMFKESIDRKRG